MTEKLKNEYVRWKVFIWTISIVTLLMGGLFTMSGRALDASNENKNKLDTITEREENHYAELKEDLVEIKTDVKTLLNSRN